MKYNEIFTNEYNMYKTTWTRAWRNKVMCSEAVNLAFSEIKEGRIWWMGMRLQSKHIRR